MGSPAGAESRSPAGGGAHNPARRTSLEVPVLLHRAALVITSVERLRRPNPTTYGNGLRRGRSEPQMVIRSEPMAPSLARGASTARAAAPPQEPSWSK